MFLSDRFAVLSEDYLLANIPLNHCTTSAVLQSNFHLDARNLPFLNIKGEKYCTVFMVITAVGYCHSLSLGNLIALQSGRCSDVGEGKRKGEG